MLIRLNLIREQKYHIYGILTNKYGVDFALFRKILFWVKFSKEGGAFLVQKSVRTRVIQSKNTFHMKAFTLVIKHNH